jgi:hypothetical protein
MVWRIIMRQPLQHDPAAPEGREFVPKTLQNISEWYPLSQ